MGISLALIGMLTTLSIINTQFQIYRNKEVEKKMMYMLLFADIMLVIWNVVDKNLIGLTLSIVCTLLCLTQIRKQ